jgi:hypothetical protein
MNQSTAELIFCLIFLKNQPVPHVSVPPSSSPLPLLLALFAEAPLVLPPANAARAFAVQGEAKFHTPPHVYLLSYDVFPHYSRAARHQALLPILLHHDLGPNEPFPHRSSPEFAVAPFPAAAELLQARHPPEQPASDELLAPPSPSSTATSRPSPTRPSARSSRGNSRSTIPPEFDVVVLCSLRCLSGCDEPRHLPYACSWLSRRLLPAICLSTAASSSALATRRRGGEQYTERHG